VTHAATVSGVTILGPRSPGGGEDDPGGDEFESAADPGSPGGGGGGEYVLSHCTASVIMVSADAIFAPPLANWGSTALNNGSGLK